MKIRSIITIILILSMFSIVSAVEVEPGEFYERLGKFDWPADAPFDERIAFSSGVELANQSGWYFFEWHNQDDTLPGSDGISYFDTSVISEASVVTCDNNAYTGTEGFCPAFKFRRRGVTGAWPTDNEVMMIRRWFFKDFSQFGENIRFQLQMFCPGLPPTSPDAMCGDATAFNWTFGRVVLWDENGRRSFGEWFDIGGHGINNKNPVTWWYRGDPGIPLSPDCTGGTAECSFTHNETGFDENAIQMISIEIQPNETTGTFGIQHVELKVAIDEPIFLWTRAPEVVNITTFHQDGAVLEDNKYVQFQGLFPNDQNWTFKEVLYSPDGFFVESKSFSEFSGGGTVTYFANTGNLAENFFIYYRGETAEGKVHTVRHNYHISRDRTGCVGVNILENQTKTIILEAETTLYDKNFNEVDTKTGGIISFCGLSSSDGPFIAVSRADQYTSASTTNITLGGVADNLLWLGVPKVTITFIVKNETANTIPTGFEVTITNLDRVVRSYSQRATFFGIPKDIPINYRIEAVGYRTIKGSTFSDQPKGITEILTRTTTFERGTLPTEPLTDDDMEDQMRSWFSFLFQLTMVSITMFLFNNMAKGK